MHSFRPGLQSDILSGKEKALASMTHTSLQLYSILPEFRSKQNRKQKFLYSLKLDFLQLILPLICGPWEMEVGREIHK